MDVSNHDETSHCVQLIYAIINPKNVYCNMQ
jgi:hypothetical protein